jgi:Predicted nucleotide-binding protein containing TIR-like domain
MKPKVFVGSSGESLDIAYAVQENLADDADVVVWSQGIFELTSNALDDLLKTAADFDFAIFVFSPVDVVTIREKQYLSVRDNVIFELGLFMGKLGKSRSFAISPKDAPDLHLPTDLVGVTTARFVPQDNLRAALGPACTQIRKAIRKLGSLNEEVIYDTRNGFDKFDVKGHGNTLFDNQGNPTTPRGEGVIKFEQDGSLLVQRKNVEGRFEVHFHPQHNAPDKPVVYRKELPIRRLRVRCEAKAENGEHTLRFVFKDEEAKKIMADEVVTIAKKDWEQIDLPFRVPPSVNLSFRIDEQIASQMASSIKIRNLVVSEDYPRHPAI